MVGPRRPNTATNKGISINVCPDGDQDDSDEDGISIDYWRPGTHRSPRKCWRRIDRRLWKKIDVFDVGLRILCSRKKTRINSDATAMSLARYGLVCILLDCTDFLLLCGLMFATPLSVHWNAGVFCTWSCLFVQAHEPACTRRVDMPGRFIAHASLMSRNMALRISQSPRHQ
jgi:hypothetical protein